MTAKALSLELEPGYLPPAVNLKHFGFVGQAGNGFHKEFAYYTRDDSLIEICTPNYFAAARQFGLRKWDVINVVYGDDARSACEVRLRVCECGLGLNDVVKVAKSQLRQFTPVEHGLETETDEAA